MLLLAQHGALARAAERLPAFRDALLLLKVRPCDACVESARAAAGGRSRGARSQGRGAREQVWARVQGTEHEPDGFNGALLSLLAAHLVDSGALVRGRRCAGLAACARGREASLHACCPPGAGGRPWASRRPGAALAAKPCTDPVAAGCLRVLLARTPESIRARC
jgi:hypothetical protein